MHLLRKYMTHRETLPEDRTVAFDRLQSREQRWQGLSAKSSPAAG